MKRRGFLASLFALPAAVKAASEAAPVASASVVASAPVANDVPDEYGAGFLLWKVTCSYGGADAATELLYSDDMRSVLKHK